MITVNIWKEIWEDNFWNEKIEPFEVMLGVILSIFSIPIDILISPLEIISAIITKIINRRK